MITTVQRTSAVAFAAILTGAMTIVGCGVIDHGDSTAARNFHQNLKIGTSLIDAIVSGEETQSYDIKFEVTADQTNHLFLEIGRYSGPPYIRITQPETDPNRPSSSRPYIETGYANRTAFSNAVAQTMPQFYSCGEFKFIFGRLHGWPNDDTFLVKVDNKGQITAISMLRHETFD